MNLSKVALILGVTLMGLMGAMYYMKSEEALPMVRVRGGMKDLDDLKLRMSMFKDWMKEHKKLYSAQEMQHRFEVWNEMYDFIQEHNAKNLSWTVGFNQFSDLTTEEFSAIYLGFKGDINRPRNEVVLDESDIPNDIDWRTKGAVTAVKNQGQCGSCYCFSSTGALEGLYKIKKGTLISLSEQQLLDCTSSYGNQGCNGGLMDNCFKYTKAKGIMKGSDYTYKGTNGTCRYSSTKVLFKNTGFIDVTKNSPTQLKAAVNLRPVAVAVQANEKAFQSYTSGIISSGCGTQLDHAVLAVGYVSTYWIVKNSWGTGWGEKGYVRIATGTQNSGAGVCGINSYPSYPTM